MHWWAAGISKAILPRPAGDFYQLVRDNTGAQDQELVAIRGDNQWVIRAKIAHNE